MDALKQALLTPLKQIFHPKGDVYHAMKASDAGYAGFGEAYFTSVIAGETKGWKKHQRMTLNLVVPIGQVTFFVHDTASGATQRFDLGPASYARLTVPPGLWVAFRGVGEGTNLVLNLASIEHDPAEAENLPLETFLLETA